MRAGARGHDDHDTADYSPNKRTGARRSFGATSLLANRVVIVTAPRITNYVLLASESALRIFLSVRFARRTHYDRRAFFRFAFFRCPCSCVCFASRALARAHTPLRCLSLSLRWLRVALTRTHAATADESKL